MTRAEGKTGPIAAAVMFDALVHSVDHTHAGDLWYLSLPDPYDSALVTAFRADRHCHAACSDNMDFHRMAVAMEHVESPRALADLERLMTDLWQSPLTRIERAAQERRIAADRQLDRACRAAYWGDAR